MIHLSLFFALALSAGQLFAAQDVGLCMAEAAARYQISPALLWGIAKVESAFNPMARNVNANGSEDLGIMQINSSWLPTLRRYGIQRNDLFDPCVSFNVGAWVLSNNIHRYGQAWKAVGAYNASTESRQNTYIEKIQSVLVKEMRR